MAPKEVVGLQHVLLQASMLHEWWLCLATSEEYKDFVRASSQVVDNLWAWLSKSIDISYLPQAQKTSITYILWKLHDQKRFF